MEGKLRRQWTYVIPHGVFKSKKKKVQPADERLFGSLFHDHRGQEKLNLTKQTKFNSCRVRMRLRSADETPVPNCDDKTQQEQYCVLYFQLC
jgi:hypothetical protein